VGLVSIPDTGALRSDLVRFLIGFRDFVQSVDGQTLVGMLLAEHEEVAGLARELRDEKECIPRDIVDRAIARGELPRGAQGQVRRRRSPG
jgi:hypothetical protein